MLEVSKESIERIIHSYECSQRYALAIMQDMQRTYQYVPREGLEALAGYLGCPVSALYAMATFYKALSLVPKGEHIIKCCDGTACHIRGASTLIDGIERELGIGPGETTEDGLFSFETVNCLGSCALAPVLVVDDDEVICRNTCDRLESLGIHTEWVTDGAAAVKMVTDSHESGQDYFAVIIDYKMPKMDGIEMLKELRAEGNDVSVIFLTAYSEFSYAQSALKLLASDYLLKPFGDGELEQAVSNALEKRKRTQEKLENSKEEPLPELVLNKGDKSKYVMAAVDYISAHYGDPELCVAQIAEHLGISEGHLSHTFKRETDYTVAAYITRVRMRTAMKLLNDCRNKVYEVAEQVGYRDVAHFSSSFKRIVGVTPSEYQDRSM